MSLSFADVVADKDIFQIIVGWIGNALALFFFFSPAVAMLKLIKGEIEHTTIPYISLIANIMNCLLWFIFGWIKQDDQIYICNGIGGFTSVIYLSIFWFYFSERNVSRFVIFLGLTYIALGGIWATFQILIHESEFTGYVAMVFNIIMFAAPGQKIFEVINTGNYALIPIISSTIGLLCSTCWFIYGIYGKLTQVVVPNGLGLVFSVIQIIVWLWYYRKSKTSPTLQAFIVPEERTKA